jgi:hypothetical protein
VAVIELDPITIQRPARSRRRAVADDQIAGTGPAYDDVSAVPDIIDPWESPQTAPTQPTATASDSVTGPQLREPMSDLGQNAFDHSTFGGNSFQLRDPMQDNDRATAEHSVLDRPQPIPREESEGAGARLVASHNKSLADQDIRDSYQEQMDDARAQRRRQRAVTGTLMALGTGMNLIGAASGRPGLAALGAMTQHATAIGNPDDPVARLREDMALENDLQEQKAGEAAAADAAEARDRSLTLQEQNAQSGQVNAEANRMLRELEQQRLQQTHDSQTNPQSPSAQLARRRFAAAVREYEERVQDSTPDDWTDVIQAQENVGAADIERSIQDIQRLTNKGIPRHRGGGGGGGRSASVSLSPGQELLALEMVQRRGISIEAARDIVSRMTEPQQGSAMMSAVGGIDTQGAEARGTGEMGAIEARSRVPGWDRVEGAPEISAAEADRARSMGGQFNAVRGLISTIDRARRNLSGLEATEANAGIISQNVANAAAAQEQLQNIMREIGHYGVPQPAELARMEVLAPRITSLDGLLNAAQKYQALYSAMWRLVAPEMRARGYVMHRGN